MSTTDELLRELIAQRDKEKAQQATPKAEPKAEALPWLPATLMGAGAIALAFGLPLWLIGAWYTVKGAVLGINLLAGILGLATRTPVPGGWWVALALPVGLLYSVIEVILRPGRTLYRQLLRRGAGVLLLLILIWSLVVASDMGSTYLAVTTPASDAWRLTRWTAATPWAAISWTTVLSFVPEMLIVGGWALLRRR